ncbi:MAG TPA: DUF4355 domain-containing protein [Virgibacillus sp.]|nr:DUF4355 domain-containing protein [Virgibacillus sp.]HLR66766.1 DUF4355 domain-containing protein [Virgibacillus sp.]
MNKKYKVLPLNLQFFAEEGGGGKERDPQGEPNPDQKDDGKKSIQLTEEELKKKIEAESDRKLASALEKKEREWEQQLEKKIQDARKDAEEYAKMTQQERQEADYKKRLKKLEERERELNNRELLVQIESDLEEKELPKAFAKSLLTVQDNEKIKESIGEIKQAFDNAVNERVKKALRQDTPSASSENVVSNNPFSEETFNLTEQGRLLKEDPELFKKLQSQSK